MKYTVSLDSRSLFKLSSDLLKYADTFEDKVKQFLSRLADVGIEVAAANGGDFGQYITYTKKFENDTRIVLTAHSQTIISEWYAGSGTRQVRTEAIIPLLMAEYGSGHYAISGEGEAAGIGGQGTLNVYGHAFDKDGWYWWSDSATYLSEDEQMVGAANGRWKFYSKGTRPTQPLHKAVMACIEQVEEIAREIFG